MQKGIKFDRILKISIECLLILFIVSTLISCGGGGGASGGVASVGTEIPTSSANEYQNPVSSAISVNLPSIPASITINLPGTPDPLPENIVGYEVWRGPKDGFTIDEDGMGATGGAVKIADSSIPLPSGINYGTAEITDTGDYLSYNSQSGQWESFNAQFSDGEEFQYIIRYKYDKTPEDNTDSSYAWSSGVTVQGHTMDFSNPSDLNLFPTAKDVNPAAVTVNWNNPSSPNPVPDTVKILRKETPFEEGDDASTFGVSEVYSGNYDSSFCRWTDSTVSENTNYYYKVVYDYEDPGTWGDNHTSEGVAAIDAAVAGVEENQPANVFAMEDANIEIESINGGSNIEWQNFPSGSFYPNGKVIILKNNSDVTPDLSSNNFDEKYVVQYWGIVDAPGTMDQATAPHPMNASLPAEDQLPPGVLSGTLANGTVYSLDLANTAFKFENLPDGDYSYSFYIVDDSGNVSLPLTRTDVPCVDVSANSPENISLRRSKASAPSNLTVSYTKPDNASRLEIYYSTTSAAAAKRASDGGSGTALKGAGDNFQLDSAVLTNAQAGSYYFAVYAVYDDGTGTMHYSEPLLSVVPIAVVEENNSVKINISQTSTKNPDECSLPNKYNFNQEITFNTTLNLNEGEIRYTVSGAEPTIENSQVYDPNNKPVLSTASNTVTSYYLKAKYFTDDGSGSYNAPREDSASDLATYIIDYNAYDANFEVWVEEINTPVSPNVNGDHFTRSTDGLKVHVKYTPGCGETYSIYRNPNFKVEKVSDSEITYSTAGGYVSKFSLPDIYNRMNQISEVVAANQTAVYDSVNIEADGRDFSGGNAYRAKYFLKVAGRSYAPDPTSGHNSDLVINKNIRKADDIYVVYPKLITSAIDMWNRPAVTTYLWTKYEPVVQVDVKQKNYFDVNDTGSAVDDVQVYFNVQYAEKDKPYRDTLNQIYWISGSDIWPWDRIDENDPNIVYQGPFFDEPSYLQATTGDSLQIIDTDPFYNEQWKLNHNVTRFDKNGDGTEGDYFTKTIPAQSGRAYYQIYNRWDSNNRIGTKDHYSEIDDANMTGELDAKAFRTVVRFRVRAGNTAGYRNADDTLKSFESDEAALFDTNTSTKRYDAGQTDYTSDMPNGYKSYPIEVCEHYEGWGTDNPLDENRSTPWYQKHGVTWMGLNKEGAQNLKSDSRNKHFNVNKLRMMIYSHGSQPSGYYDIPCYNGHTKITSAFDAWTDQVYVNWENVNGKERYFEWVQNPWLDVDVDGTADQEDYNFAFYHWNKWAHEVGGTTGSEPRYNERRIWFPTSANKMRMFPESQEHDKNSYTYNNAMADSIRSASVGMILAQDILDSVPESYNADVFALAGHSLGNQAVTNATQKLIKACDAGKITVSKIPDRVDLLDPYYGTFDESPFGKYTIGENVRAYADEIKEWSSTDGDDFDYIDEFNDGYEDSKGIPFQWFRTTALTQWTGFLGFGANDDNWDMIDRVNFIKFRFSNEKHSGYIDSNYLTNNGGVIHGEAVSWYLRSFRRTGDGLDQSKADIETRQAFSSRTPVGALWDRAPDGYVTTTFFEQIVNNPDCNATMDTTDDVFNWYNVNKNDGDGKCGY